MVSFLGVVGGNGRRVCASTISLSTHWTAITWRVRERARLSTLSILAPEDQNTHKACVERVDYSQSPIPVAHVYELGEKKICTSVYISSVCVSRSSSHGAAAAAVH